MIPLWDVNPTRRLAVLTILLIAVNTAIFLVVSLQPSEGLDSQWATFCEYGLVPAHLIENPGSAATDFCTVRNQEHGRFAGLIGSQFLHAGWLHLGANMLFLWVFGNNIEDRLGRLRFLPFYLTVGVAAGVAQALATPSSTIPVVGASGAVSGILGAYLVLYPRHRVWTVVLPLFFLPFKLPAWIWLAVYLVLQIVFLGQAATVDQGEGGVAYVAHIGGFIAGAVLILPFAIGRREADGLERWGT